MTLNDWAAELLAAERERMSQTAAYEADAYGSDGDWWLVAFDVIRGRLMAGTLTADDARRALGHAEQGDFRRLSDPFADELRAYLAQLPLSA